MANTTSTTARELFCVVYRRGGSANFTWHRTLAMPKSEAQQACADTARMGYKAMVVNYAQSLAIGLPETYE
jgi:hypothetical protein